MRSRLTGYFVIMVMGVGTWGSLAHGQEYSFSWDRATVYAVAIESFANGNLDNDPPRSETASQTGSNASPSGTTLPAAFGGDLAGLTTKILEGYFENLGVDVLSVTSMYDARRGFRPQSVQNAEQNAEIPFNAFWPADYTSVDPTLGSWDDVRLFVDAAHERGIRVIMSIELPESSAVFGLDSTLAGGGQELLQAFQSVWDVEKANSTFDEVRAYFERLQIDPTPVTIATYWLSDWILRYGLDGFRIPSAENLDREVVGLVKAEAGSALNVWRSRHPEKVLDPSDFWLIGDVNAHSFERSMYFDYGFDAMSVNRFTDAFPGVDSTFSALSTQRTADPAFSVLTSVATGPVSLFGSADQITAGTNLMLLPGLVQVIYGEETGREIITRSASGPALGQLSMNWDADDSVVSAHWQKLGTFRKRHPAIGGGAHIKLSDSPYAFYRGMRLGSKMDEVIVVLGASGRVRVNVSQVFPDDTVLRDAYTGAVSIVSYGEVAFETGDNDVLLLETVE